MSEEVDCRSRKSEGFSGREDRILPSRQVLGLCHQDKRRQGGFWVVPSRQALDRAVKEGSGSCHQDRYLVVPPGQVCGRAIKDGSGSFRCSRQVGFAAGRAARVGQVGWQYGASAKSSLLEGSAAAASRSQARSAIRSSSSLSSGGLETGGTPRVSGRYPNYTKCWQRKGYTGSARYQPAER